ncbi:hypothetical protein [Sulfurimonas sp.]|uniref:hypothetical protein n=1 Tax=Sulfurimonas sp. TaxID=2022749 RepID=UPI003D09BF4D
MKKIVYMLLTVLFISGCSMNTSLINDESKRIYSYYAIEKKFSKDGKRALYKLNEKSNKWEKFALLEDENITVVDDNNNSLQLNIISKDLIALKKKELDIQFAQKVRDVIQKNIKYSDVAIQRNISGKVNVYFEILPDNQGVDITVLEYEDVYLKKYTEKFFKSIQNQFPVCQKKKTFTMTIDYQFLKKEKKKS